MKRSQTGKGLFIVFEGGEGAGKTTQLRLLVRRLKNKNLPVVVTRNPGGTQIGQKIRHTLLSHHSANLHPRAEILLYCADRAQHVAQVILPALKRKQIVVCDRYSDSTNVYQGIGRSIGLKEAQELNKFATQNVKPDLTILLDIAQTLSRKRLQKRRGLDRIESEKLDFHRRVRRGFLKLAAQKQGYLVIDGSKDPSHIHDIIFKRVEKILR